MSEVRIYKAPWKAVKLLALTTLFVIGGIWAIYQEPDGTFDSIMGWFCASFFGLGWLIGIFHFFDRRPQIIISEAGIWDRASNQDIIKWEHIKKAYLVNIFGQKFISLVVDQAFVFKRRSYSWAASLNKAVGAQNINLSVGQLKVDEEGLRRFINKMVETPLERRNVIIIEEHLQ